MQERGKQTYLSALYVPTSFKIFYLHVGIDTAFPEMCCVIKHKSHSIDYTEPDGIYFVFRLQPWFQSQYWVYISSFPDQHHRAGSWGPGPRGSGAAVHGQPELARHPLQLLHRAAHAQHQSLRRPQKEKGNELKQEDFKKENTTDIMRWILLYSPPPQPSSNLKDMRMNFKALNEHEGVCSCDLGHWPLLFFLLLIND